MRIVTYLRVSTEEQAESQAGLRAQRDSCGDWARRNGGTQAGEFADEAVSGAASLDSRPGLLDAIASLEKGDVLLVAKRDRIARDPIVAAMIEAAASRRGARIVSAAGEGTDGDGPTDVLMRRIVDAFAEYERLVIKARTKAALRAKIRRGERVGAVRYGYSLAVDGKTLEPLAAEQAVIGIIEELRLAGESYEKIAAELTRRGIPTKTGKRWGATTVWKIANRAA